MYLGSNSEYHFYGVEIHGCRPEKLERLARACEKVERDVWNASENFSKYLNKQSALVYAKKDDELVGFFLFNITVSENRLIVAANECMVLKKHHGSGLPTIFSAILTSHIQKDIRRRKMQRPYSAMVFISSTVNFKMMAAFQRYDRLAKSSSFRPDPEIEQITRQYIQSEGLTPLDSKALFVKGAFPNSSKVKNPIQPPNFVPKDFDIQRGDAFLYVGRVERFIILGLISKWARFRYGFEFSKRLIPFSRKVKERILYTRPSQSASPS